MEWLAIVIMLARIISGEAGVCDADAKMAVVSVYNNRVALGLAGGWNGNGDPSAEDIEIAMNFLHQPDVTDGAIYLFSLEDMRSSESVQEIIKQSVLTQTYTCAGGLGLAAYRGRE